MKNIISKLKSTYNYISEHQGLSEENIKINLVRDVFLKEMGYNLLQCTYEKYCREKYADIVVQITNNEYLFVETKKGLKTITEDGIIQLARYIAPFGMKWGVLTNGYEYVLINTDIKINPSSNGDSLKNKVVFWFNIFDNKSRKYTHHDLFRYLSKENIFDNETTTFFKDIAEFKSLKFSENSDSWFQYKSTLFSFFDYYAKAKKRYKTSSLEEINVDDFQEYLKYKRDKFPKKKIVTQNAIYTNYTHLSSMLNTLVENQLIRSTHLNQDRKTALANMIFEKSKKEINYLDGETIKEVINFYRNKNKNTPKLTAFLFCATMGLERNQIHCLKWSSVDLKGSYITIEDRKIGLNKLLKECLYELYEEKKSKKIKVDYVFTAYYGGAYKQVSKSVINDACNQLQEIDADDEKWKIFSPEYLRKCLIFNMFDCGYSLEQIIYVTGIDIKNVWKYISNEKIIENTRKKSINYKKLYDGILEE